MGTRYRSALLFVGLLATAACGDDNNAAAGRVRLAHLSPDAGTLNLLVNGTEVANGVVYPGASNYYDVKEGTNTLTLESNADGSTLISGDVAVTGSQDRTFAVLNTAANVEAVAYTDDNTAPASGRVRVRLIHASPSAGPLDLYVTAPGAPLDTPAFTNVAFKDASTYLDLPAGTYEFRATPTGSGNVVVDLTQQVLAGYVVTLAATEAAGGGAPLAWSRFIDHIP